MESTCHFCQSASRMNGNHWTGSEYVRVDFCTNCRDQIARAPRRPRQPRQARALYGDYAQLAAFVGIATDGSGRVNKRAAK